MQIHRILIATFPYATCPPPPPALINQAAAASHKMLLLFSLHLLAKKTQKNQTLTIVNGFPFRATGYKSRGSRVSLTP